MLKEETSSNGLNMLNSNDELANQNNILQYLYQFVKKYIVSSSSSNQDNITMAKILQNQELNDVKTSI